MEKYSSIGKNMKLARVKLDLSQKEVAENIGSNQPTIGRIESGKMHGKLFLEYLLFLSLRGVDMNTILDVD